MNDKMSGNRLYPVHLTGRGDVPSCGTWTRSSRRTRGQGWGRRGPQGWKVRSLPASCCPGSAKLRSGRMPSHLHATWGSHAGTATRGQPHSVPPPRAEQGRPSGAVSAGRELGAGLSTASGQRRPRSRRPLLGMPRPREAASVRPVKAPPSGCVSSANRTEGCSALAVRAGVCVLTPAARPRAA